MQQSITITPFDVEEELVIIYIYDITMISEMNYHLNIAKEKAEEENEKLKLLINTTMEAIIVFKDDKISDCNQIALDLLNLTSKKWVILAHFRVKNSKKHQK